MTKVIAVVGATGAQGGGLVRAIVGDPAGGFAARAITRNPASERAKALEALGVEVVQADLDDRPSVERAFDGAHGAFCVTNFFEHFSADKEIEQARTMAAAAKVTGLRHVIWSTLEDTRELVAPGSGYLPLLGGRYNVPHYDGKGEANRAFTTRDVPTTMLYTSFYWDNLIHFGMAPRRAADGRLAFVLPMGDAKLPGIAAADIGRCAFGILARGDELVGKSVGIAGEHLSGAQMAEQLGLALGEAVAHNAMPPEAFRKLGFPGADDLANMFQFKHDFNDYYVGARDLSFARALNPELQDYKSWVAANKHKIPLE